MKKTTATGLSYRHPFTCSTHTLVPITILRTLVLIGTFERSVLHHINGLVRFQPQLCFLSRDIPAMIISLHLRSVNFILSPIPNLSRIFSKGSKNWKGEVIGSRSLSQELRRFRGIASGLIISTIRWKRFLQVGKNIPKEKRTL